MTSNVLATSLRPPLPIRSFAIAAIDAGDLIALDRLLTTHPRLLRERLDYGEGYVRQPYQATPLDWADYLQRTAIAAFLRGRQRQRWSIARPFLVA